MEKRYGEEYFFAERKGGVIYMDSGGQKKEFGYRCGGQWNFQSFLDKLIELLGLPENVIDAGAGCGGMIATVNNNGIKGVGLEFSQFAIDHAIMDSKKYLVKWDLAQTPWPVERHDWVLAVDLLEHLFQEDVGKFIEEAKKKARKYIIAKICTAQLPREVWSARKALFDEVLEQAKKEGFEWLVASGHVCCEFPDWWINKFVGPNWVYRDDLAERLKREMCLPEDWRTTIILENVEQKNVESKSVLPTTFTSEYYDENYFAKPKGKKYLRTTGLLNGWSYANPTGEYLGCKDIAKSWKTIFNPVNMLDVGCVLPNCQVLTANGYKEIKDIQIGEKLIDGEVVKKFSRKYDGTMFFIKSLFLEGNYFTPEHPILVARKIQKMVKGKCQFYWNTTGFKMAKDVVFSNKYYECDYVVVPKIKEEKEIYITFPLAHSNHSTNLGRQLIDEKWAQLFGWYLAEGCIDGDRVIVFNLGNEPEYAKEILSLAKNKGINGKAYYRKTQSGETIINVKIYCASLARLLPQLCGSGAKQKHLPHDFLFWNKNLLESLIGTYVKGDGSKRRKEGRDGKSYIVFQVDSASKVLIKEIQLALLKIGYASTFSFYVHKPSKIEGRQLKQREAYALQWTEKQSFKYDDKNNYYFKISKKSNEEYSGIVQNLKTTTETYQIPYTIHNCGRGTFLTYCRDIGINAVGFDYSEYAIKNPYPRCNPEWLKQHDATKPWPYADRSFDLATVLDVLEHFYMEDIPFVIKEMHRVASKYVFIQTAIPGSGGLQGEGKGYVLEKNKPVPIELEKYAVAGHLTLIEESKWEELLENTDWVRRRDLEAWFKAITPKGTIANWLLNSIMIWERT